MSPNKLTAEIREAFQKYFESQGHTRVASSSLVPHNDPTLLFVNAGMVQFKDTFLGLDQRSYNRATSAQKCVRAGGKHNDLENVGFTARHHTFFEMLGNFSFGDYFKKDAIHYAWEFSTKILGLPKEKLAVSVYEKDDESAEIWHKQEGVPYDRIRRLGEADNFWAMGDTGPCGPCSEIFWDQGKEVDGERYLEFWNCVFMQYERSADGTMKPLPKPSVDTGMGLERMAAVMQGVPSNYDIDLMRDLLSATQDLISARTGKKILYQPGDTHWEASALKVIVDHLRSTSFLIADGVLPSNEGRGYVLRRILRRAVRFGKRLGLEEPFLKDLFPALEIKMTGAYPELSHRKSVIVDVLEQEESRFFETLGRGLELLDQAFAKSSIQKQLPADVVFKLYDTFGFPMDLTALIAREKNYSIDETGFEKLMEKQQEMSRASWKGSGEAAVSTSVKEWKNKNIFPKFTGYDSLVEKAKILAISPADKGLWVAIDPCPFYGEGGGQAGDLGQVKVDGKTFPVQDTQKPYEGGLALYVTGDAQALTALKVGTSVEAQVDEAHRAAVRSNHTATHLLHSALREVLGKHVQQAGSLVNAEKLRFDFAHNKSITAHELQKIEDWVNQAVEKDVSLCVEETTYDEATKRGALALFGEKYGDKVRFVQVPQFSAELCGGTHVERTGDIRLFKIVSEGAIAAGTRRIEAVSRHGAFDWFRSQEGRLNRISLKLKTPADQLEDRVDRMLETQKNLEKEIEKLRGQIARGSSGVPTIEGIYKGAKIKLHDLEGADSKLLREKGDALRKAESTVIHVIRSGHVLLVTLEPAALKATPTSTNDYHAGNILKDVTTALGGRGGGQAQTAQGQLADTVTAEALAAWIKKG